MKTTIKEEKLKQFNFWDVIYSETLTFNEEQMIVRKFIEQTQQWRDQFIFRMYGLSSKIYIKLSKSEKWSVNKSDLQLMPNDSLGKTLFNFLEKNQFDLIPYVENHDVFHVITQIPADVRGEVGMQCLLFGNGKKSVFLFLSMIAGLILTPEHYKYYINCYKKGQTMNRFYDWDYEYLLNEDFQKHIMPLIYIK